MKGLTHNGKPVETIFIHCSATRPDWLLGRPLSEKVAEIRRWHVQQRKWSDIGYHYVIDRNGQIAQGRAEHVPGAHVEGHNSGSIGVCLIGGHGSSANDAFEDHFTTAQEVALRNLIEEISERMPIKRVRGHNEVANKACPGFSVARWHAGKKPRTSPVQSTTVQASAAQIASGAAGGITAVAALDGHAQIVALVLCAIVIAAAAWVMRERLRKWAGGQT